MTNPYPKPRWDLENDVLRLEQMITDEETLVAELMTITSLLGGTVQKYEVTDSKGNAYKKIIIEYGVEEKN